VLRLLELVLGPRIVAERCLNCRECLPRPDGGEGCEPSSAVEDRSLGVADSVAALIAEDEAQIAGRPGAQKNRLEACGTAGSGEASSLEARTLGSSFAP
jgi:hypothetical protein